MLRDHGQSKKYYHDLEGYNGRLDAIQAGILVIKLRRLPEWNRQRRQVAASYGSLFGGTDGSVVLPFEPAWARAVYHLYVVQVANRGQLIERLAEAGIGTGIHYPIPLHLQKAYTGLGFQAGDFPTSEKVAAQILSLPMYPQLGAKEQQTVVDVITSSMVMSRGGQLKK
jgi:dTDP-4-amino-4,6-dideoxygalactose transaminase